MEAEPAPALSKGWESRALRAPDLPAGTDFSGLYLLRKVGERTARNDKPFLTVEVGDRTGAFGFNLFADHPAFDPVKAAAEGAVVELSGRTDSYQGRFSPKILQLRIVPGEDVPHAVLEQLIECTPEDPEAMWGEVLACTESLQPPELAETVRRVWEELGEAFRASPAAISMHHAYRGGLLEHTVHMARAAQALLPLYPEIPRHLALAGVLVHDIGKVAEYAANGGRKTRTGLLNGHVVLGYRIVRKHALQARLDPDLLERLEHIVLSHQGELEWGAAVLASTPEAVFVSMVDNLDAKLGMVQQALRTAPPGAEFSERLPGLKSQVLLPPPAET
jgi:3'-5' exoribonuclease